MGPPPSAAIYWCAPRFKPRSMDAHCLQPRAHRVAYIPPLDCEALLHTGHELPPEQGVLGLSSQQPLCLLTGTVVHTKEQAANLRPPVRAPAPHLPWGVAPALPLLPIGRGATRGGHLVCSAQAGCLSVLEGSPPNLSRGYARPQPRGACSRLPYADNIPKCLISLPLLMVPHIHPATWGQYVGNGFIRK